MVMIRMYFQAHSEAGLVYFGYSHAYSTWKVLGSGPKAELQLPAYTTATATPDPSCTCDVCHSLWQHQVLNPLSKARDQTYIFMDTMSGSSPAEPQWELLFLLVR